MATIIDTGPLVANADTGDRWHAQCRRMFETLPGPLLVPLPVVPEACYMLSKVSDQAEEVFLSSLVDGRDLELVDFTRDDLERATELVGIYADFPLGFVDAAVVATAERLQVTEVATIDRVHFTTVRPRHVAAFTLLP